jgi:fluoroquinolone transport system permease protein
MIRLTVLKGLGPIDAKSIGRDALLRWIILLPLLIALLARWFLPAILQRIESLLALDLLAYYPPLMAYVLLLLVPNLIGFVTGFLLLDQRDDRTLVALQVTPLSLNGYLAYRLTMPVLLSLFLTLLVLPLSGLVSLSFPLLFLVALSAAPMAPIFALALAALSQNKVQGFALMKVSGIVLLPPLAAYFIQSNWHLLLGLVPTYWPAQSLWAAQRWMVAPNAATSFWLYLTAALLYQLLITLLLARQFNKIMHR